MTAFPAGARWLVSGGAGFIGHHLLRTLLEQNQQVRVVDDFSTGLRSRLEPFRGRFELLEGSIVDPEVCAQACRGVTHILHQAAIPSVARSVDDPAATHAACTTGTLNLLNAARKAGVRRVVYAGSSSAYGNTPELPKRVEMPTNPLSPYAVAKLAGEHYVRAFSEVYDVEGVTLRYFNVFGPGQDPESFYAAVIPKFVTLALAGEAPTIHGDGEQTRDFTYIDNVVDANLRAALAPAKAVNGRTFNVGCGDRISVNRLWAEIREHTGAQVDAEHGPARPGDVRDSLADVAPLTQATGWTPSVDLREGLGRTVAWYEGAMDEARV